MKSRFFLGALTVIALTLGGCVEKLKNGAQQQAYQTLKGTTEVCRDSSGKVTIDCNNPNCNGTMPIKIYNIIGKLVYDTSVIFTSGVTHLPFGPAQGGPYLVTVGNDTKKVSIP